jgi:hypothetical protein
VRRQKEFVKHFKKHFICVRVFNEGARFLYREILKQILIKIKNFAYFPSLFARISKFEHFAVTKHKRNQIFFERYPKIFSIFTWVLLDEFLNGFSKFGFFMVEICILIRHFWVIFKNYSMRMLSIRGNNFIAHWAYDFRIFSHMLSQRKMLTVFTCTIYAEHTGKWFYSTLSIRGNDLKAGWAYEEMISSLTEHTRKCL